MKILYKQTAKQSILVKYGITDCYLKKLFFETNSKEYLKKEHYHTGFEIHIIIEGKQDYIINQAPLSVSAGNILFIPPNVHHQATGHQANTKKYAISFNAGNTSHIFSFPISDSSFTFKLSDLISNGLNFINNEICNWTQFSQELIENKLFEIIILLFRNIGIFGQQVNTPSIYAPQLLHMAKQYILDNIELNPAVRDISLYCQISSKQLSRIFFQHENMSLFDYIRTQRIVHAQKLLQDKSLSIKEISEKMGFSSEYYFNKYFKQGYGMPPENTEK